MAKRENRTAQPVTGSFREPQETAEEDPKVTPTPVNPPPKLQYQFTVVFTVVPDGSPA
jgi:hypothetical protein